MEYTPKYKCLNESILHNGKQYYKIVKINERDTEDHYYPNVKDIIQTQYSNISSHKTILGDEIYSQIFNRNNAIGECLHLILEFYFDNLVSTSTESAYTETLKYCNTILESCGFDRDTCRNSVKQFMNIYNHFGLKDIKMMLDHNKPVFSINKSYAGKIPYVIYTKDNITILRDYIHTPILKNKEDFIPKILELCAYRYSFNEMFDILADKVEIVVSLNTGGVRVFTIEAEDLNIYENEYFKILDSFLKQSTKLTIQ